jgi:hypothetical protein
MAKPGRKYHWNPSGAMLGKSHLMKFVTHDFEDVHRLLFGF